MSFKFTAGQDLVQYANDIVAAQSPGFVAEIHGAPVAGGSQAGDATYSVGRDRFFVLLRIISTNVGIGFVDPDFFGTASGEALFVNPSPFIPTFILAGQLDPSTGIQPMYVIEGTNVRTLNTSTLAIGSQLTGPNGDFDASMSDVAFSVEGGWTVASGQLKAIVFDHLTDGIPGITVNTGANVYPQGLYMVQIDQGTLNATAQNDCIVYIDIETRRMVGIEETPGLVTATPAAGQNHTEALIAGDGFDWDVMQYIPDSDATAQFPKGELMLASRQELPAIPPGSPPQRQYIRFLDYNPFNVAPTGGNPSRTHLRERITSRALIETDPQFSISGAVTNTNPGGWRPQFDPNNNRIVVMQAAGTFTPGATLLNATVGFFARAVDPVIVTAPASRDVPRTNDVVDWESVVSGDIGEPVAGQQVDWTLTRRSTEGEVLTGAFTPASTSTVANPAIDENPAGDPEGTLVVYADGVPLVETTDYTVVLSTGVITWVTDQSGATLVTCDYEHRATAATPAFGTLLITSSQTDENGVARTQVQWPDDNDIVGEIDHLDGSLP